MGSLTQSALSAVTHLQDNTSLALSNGAAVAASTSGTAVLDNATTKAFEAHFRLTTNGFGATTGIAGKTVDLYLIAKLDGSAFPEVDASTPNLPADAYVGSFEVIDTNAAQVLDLYGIEIDPMVYKAYLINNLGQQMSAGWKLDAYTNAEAY